MVKSLSIQPQQHFEVFFRLYADYLGPYADYLSPYADYLSPYADYLTAYANYLTLYADCLRPYALVWRHDVSAKDHVQHVMKGYAACVIFDGPSEQKSRFSVNDRNRLQPKPCALGIF